MCLCRFKYFLCLLPFRPPFSPRLIKLDNPNVVFLICNTKVRHELASGEYNKRRETCKAAAEKMTKPSLRDASIHDLESVCMYVCVHSARMCVSVVCVFCTFYMYFNNSNSEEVSTGTKWVSSCKACHYWGQSSHCLYPVYSSGRLQEVWSTDEAESHVAKVCHWRSCKFHFIGSPVNFMI